jgi:pepsin A
MYALAISFATVFFEQFSDTDLVDLGGGLVIKNQSIGVASSATGFQGVDGILGCVILSPAILLFSLNSCPI